jgi:HD-like signal output (HDOD) protein
MHSYAERLLRHVDSLPCLPPVLVEAMELSRAPEASAAALAGAIRQDPGLTAEVLRLVNSSFYGFPRRIGTVTEAVTLLGFSAVRNLLFSAKVLNLLDVDESADFSPVAFWEHAVAVGLLASGLAQRTGRASSREELFVTGLLHDVGKLLEYQVLRKQFVATLALAAAEGIPVYAAEERILGITHAAVGHALASRWMLPPAAQEAIGTHHDAAPKAEQGWDVAAIQAANSLARQVTARREVPPAPVAVSADTWDRLALPPECADDLLHDATRQFADLVAVVTGWWRSISIDGEDEEDVPLPRASFRQHEFPKTTPPFLSTPRPTV